MLRLARSVNHFYIANHIFQRRGFLSFRLLSWLILSSANIWLRVLVRICEMWLRQKWTHTKNRLQHHRSFSSQYPWNSRVIRSNKFALTTQCFCSEPMTSRYYDYANISRNLYYLFGFCRGCRSVQHILCWKSNDSSQVHVNQIYWNLDAIQTRLNFNPQSQAL